MDYTYVFGRKQLMFIGKLAQPLPDKPAVVPGTGAA